MLKPKKKIVRKELKQDTLLSTYVRTTQFYYDNKKYINYALTGLLIVVVAVIIYVNNKRSNNEKATMELAKVMSIYDAGVSDPEQFRIAINGRPEQGMMGLKAIVENYGNTDAGDLADYYLANALYNLGEWSEAVEYYRNFSAPEAALGASAKFGAGACYDALKEYGEAARMYEDAAKTIPGGIRAPEYMLAAGGAYARAGNGSDALRVLNQLKEDYPDSEFARDADRVIAQYSL